MAYTFKHGDRPVEGYTIQRAVGRGGFGEVYYAISDGGREVAIKYLRDNPQVELRGVSHCINLKSPHLVSIFDVRKTVDGEYAIIMEYCSGPSLRDLLIAEPKGFAPEKAAFFVREIAKGLSYLHDRGIVHRDLKPGNIFYDDGYVKIGDYGLSKFISVSRHSGQTASVGTVHYMAPEIGSGNYSKGVDIYALGVILYEMLLGRVPFEGSTMAEVLMKHLTAQPELDELPQPFGPVIRKCLQKNPTDRYPGVDEMVDALLAVETVRQSLGGFSAKSLEGAVWRGTPERLDSPVPSPNFAGPGGVNAAARDDRVGAGPPILPERVGRRMARLTRQVEAKMGQLEHRDPRRRSAGRSVPAGGPTATELPYGIDRRKRILLSALLSVGLAVGLGVLVGSTHSEEEGVAAGLLVIFMPLSAILGRGAISWFGVAFGPVWSQRLIQACCSAPLLAMGAAPVLEDSSQAGAALWLGLLGVAVFTRWDRIVDRASSGEMNFSSALGVALKALIFTAIAGALLRCRDPEYVLVAAGVGGATALVLQATAWWLPAHADRTVRRWGPGSDGAAAHGPGGPPAPPPQRRPQRDAEAAYAGRDEPGERRAQDAVHEPSPSSIAIRPRWMVTRAFWSLASFVLMGGAIVTFLVPLVAAETRYDDVTAAIVLCVMFSSLMIFALRKTTPLRKHGFWRETLRPLLISASLFGIGATITGIARYWDTGELGDEARVALLAGLILSSMFFVVLVPLRGRRPRTTPPFVRDHAGSGERGQEPAGGASGPARSPVPAAGNGD